MNSFEHAYASAWVYRDRNMLAVTPLGIAASVEHFGALGGLDYGVGVIGAWVMSRREFAVAAGRSLERMPFGVNNRIDSAKDLFSNEIGIRAQEYLTQAGIYNEERSADSQWRTISKSLETQD